MVESDVFLETKEQQLQKLALYYQACAHAADVLSGPTGRGTPAKAGTIRRFVNARIAEAKAGKAKHVIKMRGFRPVIDKEPNVPEHIKRMWEGVP